MFYQDWQIFMNQVELSNKPTTNFEFSIIPLDSIDNDNYTNNYIFEYDYELFDNYDGKPIKVYKNQINEMCDVYVGEYFMSR